ncbi:hypothetical protein Fmac_009319 [Flemingia macrophylla]|uniref:NADH-ubiquinone oxidoreductase 21kDa subunit N-terminal domain-containing protein n=1 Tax=Flemingia macrophylla TaxID=520843 RepID=A0ABD1MZZ7_9FABA
MNTDITASTKPEYPVIDRNPPFTKVVGNFNTLDYLRFVTITGVSVTVGYLSGQYLSFSFSIQPNPIQLGNFKFQNFLSLLGIKPGIRGPSMVTGGLIGVMGGFMYAYQNSVGRLMGFFPNDDEVARYNKK